MMQYTPPSMAEGANATAMLTQLLMLQLLNQHRPSNGMHHHGQRQCWKESLEQQCKMDVYLKQLTLMNKGHFEYHTVLPPCLRQLVMEDELLTVLKRGYLADAGFKAADSGNTTELKILLNGGLSPNVRDADGGTMLHHAAKANQTRVVELLLKSGANSDPVAAGLNNQTPLNNAAYRGYLQIVKINNSRKRKINLMNWEREVRKRLKNSGKAHSTYREKIVPANEPPDMMLVQYKANPNAQTSSGNSPLHSSAMSGQLSTFKFLLLSGGNPSLTNVEGKTPREEAIENGHLQIVRLLKSAGY